jgi:hypothetical protein
MSANKKNIKITKRFNVSNIRQVVGKNIIFQLRIMGVFIHFQKLKK